MKATTALLLSRTVSSSRHVLPFSAFPAHCLAPPSPQTPAPKRVHTTSIAPHQVHIPSSSSSGVKGKAREVRGPNSGLNKAGRSDPTRHQARTQGGQQNSQHARNNNQHLLSLRSAIVSLELEAAWSSWINLTKQDLAHLLSPRDQIDILSLCSRKLLPTTTRPKSADHWQERYSEWAIAAIRTGSPALASGWARFAIADGRPEQVSILFKEFVKSRKAINASRHEAIPSLAEQGSAEAHLDAPASSEVQADTTTMLESRTSQDGPHASPPASEYRIDLGITRRNHLHDLFSHLIIAKAIQDDLLGLVSMLEAIDFGSIFQTFFDERRVVELLSSLATLPIEGETTTSSTQLQERVLKFTRHAELARGISTGIGGPQRITRLLGSLFSTRKPDSAWTLFLTAMEATSGSASWLLMEGKVSPIELGKRAAWTQSCWSICLSSFISLAKPEYALRVWSTYHGRGLQPCTALWNALLNGYSRSRNYEAAEKSWKQMAAQGQVRPDAMMYTTMISVFFKARKTEEALSLFSEMRIRHDRGSDPLQITTETCNAVIHGLCVNGLPEQAEEVLAQMKEEGPEPTIGTVNTLLRAYGRIGDMTALAGTLRQVEQLKLVPDVVTFTTVLDALLRKGGGSAGESVMKVLKVMDSLDIRANAITYTALVKACLVGTEAANVDMAAQSMFTHSGRGKLTQGDRSGEPAEPRIDAALELLDRMIDSRIVPTEVTYTAIIGACLQYPYVVANTIANKRLPSHYLVPPKPAAQLGETPETVAIWQQRTPDISLALLLLERMRARRLSPNLSTFHYLIVGLGRPETDRAAFLRALHLMDEMSSSLEQTPMGPFVTSILRPEQQRGALPAHRAGALHYTTWVLILTTLSERLEQGTRHPEQRQECIRALRMALRLMQDCEADSLRGTDGGRALGRVMNQAEQLSHQAR